MRFASFLKLSWILVATACAGEDQTADAGQRPSDSGVTPMDSGVTPDTGVGELDANEPVDSAVQPDAGPVTPEAPVLLTARLVVHGTMSLAWRAPDSTCDTFTIHRKQDAGPFEVAQTVTGQATSAQDMPGHANGTYCYTITCNLGGLSSPPSNERCVDQ